MSNPFFNVVKREIQRIKEKPLILIIMFVIPLLICFVLNEIFKEGVFRDLPIAVLDEDNTDLSRKVVRTIDAMPTCKVEYKVSDIKSGKDFITEGKIYAFLVIPKNFKKDVLKGLRPKVVYYYNNQMMLIGGAVTKDINVAIQAVFAGLTSEIYTRFGIPREIALSQINLIKVDEHTLSNPYINYSYMLSTAAFIHTFQIIAVFITVWAFGSEFKRGTSKQWLEAAGNNAIIGYFGKLFPYTAGFMIMILFIYYIYFVLYCAPFQGNVFFAIAATLLFVLAYQFTSAAFVAITGNMRLSLSAGAFYTSLGFTFAGMTFPNIAMPALGRYYSALLPLRPYLAIMIDQSQRGIPVIYDLNYVIWIILLCAIGLMTLPLLEKKMSDENQWYKL